MLRAIPATDQPYSFTVLDSSPAERLEPISLEDAKTHLRFGSSSEDVLIRGWIAAARAMFEGDTGRQIVNAVFDYTLDRFPQSRTIQLPRPPLQAVSSVKYDDGDGNEQVLDPDLYRVLPSVALEGSPAEGVLDPYCPCGRIELKSGQTWPTTICQAGAVRIRRTCGYGPAAADVPELIKAALYFLVGHFHRNRAEVTQAANLIQVPLGASMLMHGFKYTALQTHPPMEYHGGAQSAAGYPYGSLYPWP